MGCLFLYKHRKKYITIFTQSCHVHSTKKNKINNLKTGKQLCCNKARPRRRIYCLFIYFYRLFISSISHTRSFSDFIPCSAAAAYILHRYVSTCHVRIIHNRYMCKVNSYSIEATTIPCWLHYKSLTLIFFRCCSRFYNFYFIYVYLHSSSSFVL